VPELQGRDIGGYTVVSLLGRGGMGEVYRARDVRLGRDVAIKILPVEIAGSPERIARFEREARLLAALSHAHIGAIYGVVEDAGVRGLVLELVDGQTLGDRIAAGLSQAEALRLARQIAEALDFAHERGIVHRDLKPDNIKITGEGEIKVLDFGIAKVRSEDDAKGAAATITLDTSNGVILGTAAFMSPEQARGTTVDKRADIWAFGCVLYQMLTARQAFTGATVSDTIAAVLEREPDWSALPAGTPPAIRRLLRHCLEKDVRRRLRDIGDAWIDLEHSEGPALAFPARSGTRRTMAVVGIGALAAGVGLGWLAATSIRRGEPAPPSPQLFVETLPESRTFEAGSAATGSMVALSPDGRTLAYVAEEAGEATIFVRPLDRALASPIGERGSREPFFSPDGRWIGFRVGRAVKRKSLQGGPAETIATLPSGTAVVDGIHWSPDDTILVGAGTVGLIRMRIASNEFETLVSPAADRRVMYPQALPGGKAILYTEVGDTSDSGQIMLLDLATRTSKPLRGGLAARYLPTGHLIFVAGTTLSGIGFDPDRLLLRGTAVPLVTEIRVNPEANAVQVALNDSGTLAYLPAIAPRRTLVWIDRKEGETAVGVPPRAYAFPRVSPDGTRIAVTIKENNQDVHLWDISRRVLRQLTFDPGPNTVVSWIGNDRVAYSGTVGGWGQVFEQSADGLGTPRQVTTGIPSFPYAATRDGSLLIVREFPPDGGWDIGLVPIEKPDARSTVERTKAVENNPALSPDGRWLAYQSNKTGRFEIYVRPFPVSGQGEFAITAEGATRPMWARDGTELYYWTVDRRSVVLKAIRVTPGPPSGWGAPVVAVKGPYVTAGFDTDYDVWDRRFLLMKEAAEDPSRATREIVVVQNWREEVRRLVPVE
jgi:Tol biopolymer transport system component